MGRIDSKIAKALAAAFLLLAAVAAQAQRPSDVPLPPRIDQPPNKPPPSAGRDTPTPVIITEPIAPRSARAREPLTAFAFGRPPNAAQLAPLPAALEETKGDAPDEIVVIGGGWRLPDLGSAAAEEEKESRRLGKTILPLYDPENPVTFPNTFVLNAEQNRVGYIELFKLKFGKKPKE
ncbi:MAG TPA: hypothetical protein VFX89_05630 [Gammaproteobacteria bacterium]|nr:hypothetical protein [Gammaproteobacteria bacterium]